MNFFGKQYSRQKYFNNEYTFYIPVSKGKNSFCELIPDCSIEFLACEDDSVTIQADIPEMLSAPVNSAQIYGTINIYVECMNFFGNTLLCFKTDAADWFIVYIYINCSINLC